jgi:NADH-quinone oxidoreductase subunit L
MLSIQTLTLLAIGAPLLGATVAGLYGRTIGVKATHTVTILGVAVALVAALCIDYRMIGQGAGRQVWDLYTWVQSGSFRFTVGFWVDHLTALMMTVVTFVSLLVHIYSIGYMHGDKGYQRFFAYMSLFTFAMLVLVTANNLFLLFFGWEGVGLVSYLLIGFWYEKDSATTGSLKAFLVNRVGDFGLLLGVAAIVDQLGVADYASLFQQVQQLVGQSIEIIPGHPWSLATVVCLLLFMGAMGKSAQVPLHVWLPESMEGPTPISALIHAATMVTAGIYMVARLSPLYELSPVALSTLLVIGATGAFFLGLVGVVQNDIKRVVAYSTISQLGYMMAANGASAFSAAIFHLSTHACFKALLFLGAGSVICAMHHEQDMRIMGGLRRYMPITYGCCLVGALALCAFPPFSGYYSKDAIIAAVHLSALPGASYAYWCLLCGAFVTALYTFRAFFMTFHGQERIPANVKSHVKESPWTICLPLVLLAIPSVLLGVVLVEPMLYQSVPMLSDAITVAPAFGVLHQMAAHYHGIWAITLEAFQSLPFWFALAGALVAYVGYIVRPEWPAHVVRHCRWFYWVLVHKFGFDAFNDVVFVRGTRVLSQFFYRRGDVQLIDRVAIHGSCEQVNRFAWLLRLLQTGYVYHYALAIIVGMVIFLCLVLA